MNNMTVDNKVFRNSLLNIVGIPSIFFIISILMIHYQSKFLMDIYYESEKITETKLSISEYFRLYVDMETSLRGYTLSGDKKYLEPFVEAEKLKNNYKEVVFKKLTNHEYQVSKKYRQLVKASEAWYTFYALKVPKSESSSITEQFRQEARAKFDLIRDQFKDMNLLLDQINYDLKSKATNISLITFYLEIAIVFIFIIILYILLKKQVMTLVSSYRNLIQVNELQRIKTEEASKAKDLFLANMSHEIRTPLGSILGFVELALEDQKLQAETKSHLLFVKRNGVHLLNLVEDLFDLSKVGTNKLEIFNEKADVLEIIKDIRNIFSSQCENSKIYLDLIIKDKIPKHIETDPVRLKQILMNLVGNAIKFSKLGDTVKLIISTYEDQLIFDVIDQGLGIPADKQESIFTAFEQVDINHTRKYGGAGLGLSISKNLSNLLHGNLVLVESKIDLGSHFRASFKLVPLDTSTFGQDSIQMEEVELTNNTKPYNFEKLKGRKILLAEDSKENQILFKIFMESEGLSVEIVESGMEAVKSAFNNSHDLILMDIQMPGLDGYEAMKIIKDEGFDKKIIALTAHSMAGEKEKCLKLGFDGYISKPVSKIYLLAMISKYIN